MAQLERQIAYIHDVYRQDALVEEYLEGREFNVSILGEHEARVLAISEIDFSSMPENEPRIVSYRAKWDEESVVFHSTVPVCPAEISPRMANRIRDIALRSSRVVGCRDYTRVDMRTDAAREHLRPRGESESRHLAACRVRARGTGGGYDLYRSGLVHHSIRPGTGQQGSRHRLCPLLTLIYHPIRRMLAQDRAAVVDIVRGVGNFNPAEMDCALELVDIYLNNPRQNDYRVVVAEDADGRSLRICLLGADADDPGHLRSVLDRHASRSPGARRGARS